MNFNNCLEKLSIILSDQHKIAELKEDLGEIEELFIASSEFMEMYSDFNLLKENDFELDEDQLTSAKQDYVIYALTTGGDLVALSKDQLL